MSDLISRQVAINAIENTECELLPEEWDEIMDAIMQIPSAQPEIIQCKDCLIHGVCKFEQWLGLNGYCSKAERREDG